MSYANKFLHWRKSSLSNGGLDCVEIAFAADGTVGIRDSKQGEKSPVLEFSKSEWNAFIGGIKADEFEHNVF